MNHFTLQRPSILKNNNPTDYIVLSAETKKLKTEIRTLRQQLKEAGDRIEGLHIHNQRILSTIAHDLRSPLAGIIQTTELLKEDFQTMEPYELRERLDLLFNLSTDQLNMLDSLVDWARIEYSSEAYSPAHIELDQYVHEVFGAFNEMAVTNDIHLRNEMKDNTRVYADGKLVQSILQNIVSNSLKNTPPGGDITVSAKRKEDKIIVQIQDTGIGIPKEVLEKLFTPKLKDLARARKEKKGTGIELLLVKSFVAKNGGELWVESIVGEGTSFYFTLPFTRST